MDRPDGDTSFSLSSSEVAKEKRQAAGQSFIVEIFQRRCASEQDHSLGGSRIRDPSIYVATVRMVI